MLSKKVSIKKGRIQAKDYKGVEFDYKGFRIEIFQSNKGMEIIFVRDGSIRLTKNINTSSISEAKNHAKKIIDNAEKHRK